MPGDSNTHNSHAIISGTKSDGSTQIKGSASSGDITLGESGVTAGTYRSVTVNSKGIVVAGSSTDTDTNT
jgi:phage-related tail fiber protein